MLAKRILLGLICFWVIILPNLVIAQADKIYRQNNQAVVLIVTYDKNGQPLLQGSGFIVRSDGVIVTNHHVVEGATSILVKTVEGEVFRVTGYFYWDAANDLVILKTDGNDLPTVTLGDSDRVSPGENVYVIGSPKGLENSITRGIISGVRQGGIQMDAPISSGSSGGPVFNDNGEVIAVATFGYGNAQNLNFAMPINIIKGKIAGMKVTDIGKSPAEDYSHSASYWFQRGWDLSEAGRYQESIEAYTEAIRLNPKFAIAYSNRGVSYGKKQDYDKAIADYNEAIRLDLKNAIAYFNRGLAYSEKGDYDRAIADFSKAISLDPKDAEAYYSRGLDYADKERFKEAVADGTAFLRLAPNDPKAPDMRRRINDWKNEVKEGINKVNEDINQQKERYNYRGLTFLEEGNYDRAIEDFTEAIRLDPKYAEAYSNRGNAYCGKRDFDKAIADYDEAIRLDRENTVPYSNRGNAYYEKGNYDRAIADFTEAIRLDVKYAKSRFGRGLAYYKKQDYDKAIADFQEAIRLNPKDAETYYNRGLAYYEKMNYDRAIGDYSAAIRLNPQYAEAYYSRGLAYADKERFKEAVVDGTLFLRLAPNDPKAPRIRKLLKDWYSKVK